jgi:hypothetical protein
MGIPLMGLGPIEVEYGFDPLLGTRAMPQGIWGHMSHDIVDKFGSLRTNIPRLIVDGRGCAGAASRRCQPRCHFAIIEDVPRRDRIRSSLTTMNLTQVWCTWVTRAPLPTVEHHSRSADGLPFEGDHRRPVQLRSIPGSPGYEAARSYDLLCDSGVSTRCIMYRLASSLHHRVCGSSSDPASGVRITSGGGDII